jgi:2-aminoadipate transaminase
MTEGHAPADLYTDRVEAKPVARPSAVPAHQREITFQGASPDPASYPAQRLAAAMGELIASQSPQAFDYDIGLGVAALREGAAGRLALRTGAPIAIEQVMITQGAVGAIEAIASAFLDPGDAVFIEAFTFRAAIRHFRSRGAVLVECPADGDGFVIAELEEAIAQCRARGQRPKLVYFGDEFSNPTGVTLSDGRRQQLAELAQRESVVLVQDDTYSEVRFAGTPPKPMLAYAPDRTVVVGSCSKILAPSLRLGWTIASAPLTAALMSVRNDLGVSVLLQRAAAQLLDPSWFDPHIASVIELHREKQALVRALLAKQILPITDVSDQDGGFYFWITMAGGSADALAAAAPAHGVRIMPQSYFSPSDRDGEHFRLGFSQVPFGDLEEGLSRLAEAMG